MSSSVLNLDQLKPWVEELIKDFSGKQLILLNGELGAGKTEWVKTVLEKLGSEEVASPTYGLIHEYETPTRKNVFHIDLYRIEGEDDLESSGFWDLFELSEGLIFVEWSSRISGDQFPLHWPTLDITISKAESPDQRHYSVVKKTP